MVEIIKNENEHLTQFYTRAIHLQEEKKYINNKNYDNSKYNHNLIETYTFTFTNGYVAEFNLYDGIQLSLDINIFTHTGVHVLQKKCQGGTLILLNNMKKFKYIKETLELLRNKNYTHCKAMLLIENEDIIIKYVSAIPFGSFGTTYDENKGEYYVNVLHL